MMITPITIQDPPRAAPESTARMPQVAETSPASQVEAPPSLEARPTEEDERSSGLTLEDVERWAEKAGAAVERFNHKLSIEVHEETGQYLVKVVDTDTGEVIREIPSEELLDLASKMREMAGLLFEGRS